MIQTNRGPMTAEQVMDEVTYGSYAAQRDYGLTFERLSGFFGDWPCEQYEARYRAERRLA